MTMMALNGYAASNENGDRPVFHNGRYQNSSGADSGGLSALPGIFRDYLNNRTVEKAPSQSIPVQAVFLEQLLSLDGTLAVKLGHSSLLLRLQEKFWLVDPVFAERVSPVQWAGPKRFHQPPLELNELSELEGVIISHDHYDHLDRSTILALNGRVKQFYVPKGIASLMQGWGIRPGDITELDWWESANADGVTLTAAPAQHFSGRALLDSNKRLWASWVIMTDDERLFFSGDSGYFDGFKTIGERYGPFDLTFMETGAYNDNWADIHMFPEESLQAHMDVRGKYMIPVHNGTFNLAMHSWFDPMERVLKAAEKHNQKLLTPVFGEVVQLSKPEESRRWWREMQTAPSHSFSSSPLI